jgi:DnaJ-domain-containing protein 1
MRSRARTHYQELDVREDATEPQIRRAFRAMARRYHPDRNPKDKTAEAKFKRINTANGILSDAHKRAIYDASLAHERAVAPAAQRSVNASREATGNGLKSFRGGEAYPSANPVSPRWARVGFWIPVVLPIFLGLVWPLFGLVTGVLFVAWTLFRHLNGRRALLAVMAGRRDRRWMTVVTIGFGLLLTFRSTVTLRAEIAEDAQRARKRADAEAALPHRIASWRERLAAAMQSASADDGYNLVLAVEDEIDSAQWSLGAPVPSSVDAIRQEVAMRKRVLLAGIKQQRLKKQAR